MEVAPGGFGHGRGVVVIYVFFLVGVEAHGRGLEDLRLLEEVAQVVGQFIELDFLGLFVKKLRVTLPDALKVFLASGDPW